MKRMILIFLLLIPFAFSVDEAQTKMWAYRSTQSSYPGVISTICPSNECSIYVGIAQNPVLEVCAKEGNYYVGYETTEKYDTVDPETGTESAVTEEVHSGSDFAYSVNYDSVPEQCMSYCTGKPSLWMENYCCGDDDDEAPNGLGKCLPSSPDACCPPDKYVSSEGTCVKICDADLDRDPDFSDCQPFNPFVNKYAVEIGDGIDNDCDGIIDENLPAHWSQINDPGFAAGKVNVINDSEMIIQIIDSTSDGLRHGIISDPFVLEPYKNYTTSVDVKCPVGSAVIELRAKDTIYQDITSQTSWHRIAIPHKNVNGGQAQVALYGRDASECYFDNVMVTSGDKDDFKDYEEIESYSCCPDSACWSGTACTEDMSGDPFAQPINDYRCINGTWGYSPYLYTWDREQKGFCPQSGQCLVDLQGDSQLNNQPQEYYTGNNPQCISDGQYILDNLCEKGYWNSRTKYLALSMIEAVKQSGDINNFTIFCDKYNNTLIDTDYGNILDYIIGKNIGIFRSTCFENIDAPCVNSFCIAEYRRTGQLAPSVILGTTLNKEIDEEDSFLNALELKRDYCSEVHGQDYSKCSSDDKVWYNPSTKSIIYARNGFTFDSTITDEVKEFFINPIDTISTWISDEELNFTILEEAATLDNIYVAKRPDGKTVTAIREHDHFIAEFDNFGFDVCPYFRSKAVEKGINQSVKTITITCNTTDQKSNVFSNEEKALNIWSEFTSALRIK